MINISCKNDKPKFKIDSSNKISEAELVTLMVYLSNNTYYDLLLKWLQKNYSTEVFNRIYNKILFMQQSMNKINNKTLNNAKVPYVKGKKGIVDDNDQIL